MSEGEQSGQEKSHEATLRKLQKAREKGDVPQSREANIAASYLGLLVCLLTAAGGAASALAETLAPFLTNPEEVWRGLASPSAGAAMREAGGRIVGAVSPVFLMPMAAIIASLVAQQAVTWAPDKLKPKADRLSPVSNAKQKYGPSGLMEFAKSTTKLLFIGTVVGIYLVWRADEFVALLRLDGDALAWMLFREAVWMTGLGAATSVVIAGIDLPFQRQHHAHKQRMTGEELKREMKESEGDPYMKQSRQQRARDIANNKMLADVPQANVVIVNPTHYAVALSWTRDSGAPPVLVAKGVDEIAARIREIAAEAGVPIHRDPPTARAIHAGVEIGEPIDREHFAAVAAAIRYAEEVRRAARERG